MRRRTAATATKNALSGSECRAKADCDFDIGDTIGQFIGPDGGISIPTPVVVDGGFIDGGFAPVVALDGGFVDGGFVDVDGGATPVRGEPIDGGFSGGEGIDGGPGPQPDAGSIGEAVGDFLQQGVPVCRSTLFDCNILALESCCTSERITAVDIGFCMPALLCLGGSLP